MKNEKIFKTSSCNRPILNHVLVQNNIGYSTDLDIFISAPIEKPNGLYPIKNFDIENMSEMSIEDYPDLKTFDHIAVIDTIKLNLMSLEQLFPFISKDETRIVLCGLFFDKKNVVATNGYILKYFGINKIQNSYIVPRAFIKKVIELSKYKKIKNISFEFNTDYVQTTIDNILITCKLIKREFPNWENAIPNNKNTSEIRLDQNEILDKTKKYIKIVKRVIIEHRKGFSFLLDSDKKYFDFCLGQSNDHEKIHFNFNYFLICVKNQMNAQLYLKIISSLTPATINDKTIICPIEG